MANVPQPVTLTNSSVNILNAIRNSATIDYRNYVPYATEDGDSIRGIGAIIMDYPALQNEFLNALIGRIGLVIVTSKSYQNPWSVFKKGVMEFGETVEELFVNIANVQNYNPEDSEATIYTRNIPDVKSAFHVVNYKKVYPVTIQNDQLRSAFLSWDGISDLIAKITDSLYTSMNYDEYQTMKYLIAKAIINGQMEIIGVSGTISENVVAFKSISNDLTFYSNKHNVAGVYTSTLKDDQYLIIDTATESQMNVEVLATAFNMDKAEFMGHVILVDGFGDLDTARLNELFYDDPAYEEIGSSDLETLNSIPAVIVDKNWFMVYDQMMQFTENYNGKGLYWNYFLHTWKVMSVSPFANAAVFTTGTPAVTSVTVSPSTATVAKGGSVQLTATVQTTNFAPQRVTWSSANAKATVDSRGFVTIASDFSGSSVVITAISTFDSSKKGTATITVQ